MSNGAANELEFEMTRDIDRRFMCPICLALMTKPMQTKCGHRFCKLCIFAVVADHEQAKCPVDNTMFIVRTELFADLAFEREILSLSISCRNQDTGCAWSGEIKAIQDHADICPYGSVTCEACGRETRRKYLEKHMTFDCPMRVVECEHCKIEMPNLAKTKHQVLSCLDFPVNCAQCGQTGIKRKAIAEHIDQESGTCPATVVRCPYHSFGCSFVDQRRNMTPHLNEAVGLHNILLINGMQRIEERLGYFEQEMYMNQNVCSSSHYKLQEIERSIAGNYSGCLLWQIDFASKNEFFESPLFYTSSPGYRFGANLDITDSNIYASFSLSIMVGKYDRMLTFPFSGLCLVTVFDQSDADEKKNHTVLIDCQAIQQYNSLNLQSSTTRVNDKFMKIKHLVNPPYAKNRTVFIEVKVMQVFTP